MTKAEPTGLTQKQAEKLQAEAGFNELPDKEKRSLWRLAFEILTEPMIFLLTAVVVVYFMLGDRTEALVLMVSVVVIIGIELYQNSKTEKALDALRNLSSPNCVVIRDGRHQTIPSREVVVGDYIVVSEGSRVPADGRLVSGHNIMADESILTGESVPADKTIRDTGDPKSNTVHSGTMVVKGHGVAMVVAIGTATEMGKIGISLNAIKPEKTNLQKEIARAVKLIATFAVGLSGALMLLFWILRGDLLHGFLAALTLSIAILPEEFPVVLTVFMALGAWRLAKSNVLTRKNQTIETLGSATVLCTDKTGTLTENRMQVQYVTDAQGVVVGSDSQAYDEAVSFGVLASQKNPFDPMEEAFIAAAKQIHSDIADVYKYPTIIKEYPLEESSLSVGQVWGDKNDTPKLLALKGAPEAVFELCQMPSERRDVLQRRVTAFAQEGLRVLAVAQGEVGSSVKKSREQYTYEFVGLVALADPIRKEAAAAVKLAHQAGIRVVMITGDFAETARRIGSEIGLAGGRVVTGDEFLKMTPAERQEIAKTTQIFSRVAPTAKLEIVNALKHGGEVVAMTGDGVNDGPALKAAHIGIAMGQRGTDVAREASSIVLLDDNFASIVQGVRIGRRIFANLQKAAAYILTVHIPIAILSIVPVLFGWQMILLPVHIVFFEFIIDPSCTLVFEGEEEEPDAMKQRPRRLNSPLFSRQVVLHSALAGLFVAFVIALCHWRMVSLGWSDQHARSITFLLVVLTNVFLILAISGGRVVRGAFTGRKPNALVIVVGFVALALAAVYMIAPLRDLFLIDPISWKEAAATTIIAVAATGMIYALRQAVSEQRRNDSKALRTSGILQ